MTVRTYGPTAQSVKPTQTSEVSVVDHSGSAVTLSTAVSLDGQGRVSFAVDDATAPHDIFVKVHNASGDSIDRWHFGGSTGQGELRAALASSVATLESALSGWGAASGTYTIAKDNALKAAVTAVAQLARIESGQTEQR